MNTSLKSILPRVYDDARAFLQAHRPDLAPQLDALVVTLRCPCGSGACVAFTCESTDPAVSPITGRQPLYYDVPSGAFSIGISGDIVTGFEMSADYDDGYVHQRLCAAGFSGEQADPTDFTEQS